MSELESFHTRVLGPPQFYGNKCGFVNQKTGKVIITEQKGKGVRSWQDTLRAACVESGPPAPLNEPVRVHITVMFARPAAHFGSGRNAGRLKESAPLWVGVKPDGDKIARAVLDCLTGTWVIDDARVAELHISKFYVSAGRPEETQVWMQRTEHGPAAPRAGSKL